MMKTLAAMALPILLLLGGGAAARTAATQSTEATQGAEPITILIGIDGFRADYLDRGLTPHLKALAEGGVRGAMRPSFPSVTLPNFYTLLTGKVPDHHGIVGNEFESVEKVPFAAVDPATGQNNYWNPAWWNGALPLWASIEARGGKTAHLFYPSVGVDAAGNRPVAFRRYTPEIAPADEPAELFKWLDVPAADQPHFLTLWFYPADHEGHGHGPNSPELNAGLQEIDTAIGNLVDGLRQRGLLERTNLVIVADHGMAEVPPDQNVVLDDLLPIESIRPVSLGAYAAIELAPGASLDSVTARLVGQHGHAECWRKGDLPPRFRFGGNPRIAPIICLADVGWNITTREVIGKRADRPRAVYGNHGYDPAAPEMAAIFIANGPAFRSGVTVPMFDNTNIYFLLARLTGTPPQPGDGSLAPFGPVLRAP